MKTLLMILFFGCYFALLAQEPNLEVEGGFGEHIRFKRDRGFIDITASQSPQGLVVVDTAGTHLMSIISKASESSTVGRLGLGTLLPQSMISVIGPDDYLDGPNIFLSGKGSDQVESGRIRFVEGTATNNLRGGYLHYDGSANRFHMGVHNTSSGDQSDDLNALTIHRNNGFVGMGTEDPLSNLHVVDKGFTAGQRRLVGLFESKFSKRPAIMCGANGTVSGMGMEYDGTIGSNLHKFKIFFKNFSQDRDILTVVNGIEDGKVGLNTNTPKVDLEVSSGSNPAIRITNRSSAGHPKIQFDEFGAAGDWDIHPSDGRLILSTGDVNGTLVNQYEFTAIKFIPTNSGSVDLGTFLNRWKGIFLTESPNVSSDRRLKSNIQKLSYGLEEILQLNPVSYALSNSEDKMSLGLIAQEVNEIVPEIVDVPDDPEAFLSLRYSELIPVLINAIQEQNGQIKALESLCTELKVELRTSRQD